jgi:hypothetical protein
MEVEVCKTLDIGIESLNDRYLALPAMVGEDKSDCFKHSVQILVALISGWWKHSIYGWQLNMSLKLYWYFQAQYLTFRKKLVTKFLMLFSKYGGVMIDGV